MATNRLSAEQEKAASGLLFRLDKCAQNIQENHQKWGLSFESAKGLVNHLDRIADEFEKGFFGDQSLQRRQVEVLKQAKVIEKDSDEGYMQTFANPMAPIQTDGDEPYMSAYADDQSSAVQSGKSTTGRPLVGG